ncbi:MAG: peptidylprolyl isomerase [Kistimonas sp.]|nr:peptidylprolyl isomerase [Kistimonas sp.]
MKNMRAPALKAALSLMMTLITLTPVYALVEPLDRVAAVVNDDIIMESELVSRLGYIRNKLQQKGNIEQLPGTDVLRAQVLERMIMENLQLQIARRMGASIDDQALNEAVDDLASRNGMTREAFYRVLREDGLTYPQAREQVRRELLINRVRRRKVMERIQVTDREIENYRNSAQWRSHQLQTQEYRLGHILVSLPDGASPQQIAEARKRAQSLLERLTKGESFSSLAVSLSQGEHALEGGDLGWRKLDQLPSLFANKVEKMKVGEVSQPLLSPSGFHIIKLTAARGQEKTFEKQVRARHILIKPNELRSSAEAQELATNLYKRLGKGASFAELAKAYSDDPGSASRGGELGWVRPDTMVPAFRDKLRSQADTALTKPFESQYGWHILQVLEHRDQDISEQVRTSQIRELIGQRKFEESLQVWLRQLRDEAYVEIKARTS